MNIDWTEAPDDATHWDALGGCFCNEQGWWIDEKYITRNHLYWGDRHYIPRPVEPATTAWDGTGFPPVGTICECLFNDGWVKVVVLSVNGDEAWVRRPRGSHIVSKGLGNEFRPIRTQAQREREDAVEKALAMDCHPREGTLSRHDFCGALYDAGMLRRVGE